MVTASHNPKNDNGYKVYFSNGAQITSPHDKGIQRAIEENLKPWPNAWMGEEETKKNSKCNNPLEQIWSIYNDDIRSRIYDFDTICKSDIRITYTALHGVGHNYLTEALKIAGFKHYFPVQSQMNPDPDFPTVTFPNPEEGKGVLVSFTVFCYTVLLFLS